MKNDRTVLKYLVMAGLLFSFSSVYAQIRGEKYAQATADKFKWLAAYSAPRYYPVTVHTGYFGNEKKFITPIGGSGSTHKGQWGATGAIIITGDDYKEVPSNFSVTWSASAEKKTYTCEGKLDQQRILKLFQQGLDVNYNRAPNTYNRIIVGMAPGGLVSIWLSGSGVVTEVGSFQGNETKFDLTTRVPNPDKLNTKELLQREYEDEVQPNIRQALENGTLKLPIGAWQTYRKKYIWKPQLELPDGQKVSEIVIRYFNGEAEVLVRKPLLDNLPAERPVPRNFQLQWESADSTYLCRPSLSEDDVDTHHSIINAFAQIMGEGNGEPGVLLIRVDADQKVIRFFVEKSGREAELKGFEYKIFKRLKKTDKSSK